MAEIFGVISASFTVAESAVILSRALFNVVEALKNARKEVRDIADQLSHLSGSLHTLADIMRSQQELCKPALFKNTKAIIARYYDVEAELKSLLVNPRSLARLSWCIKRTKVKSLLKNIEAIKSSIILELHVVQLAKEEGHRPLLANASGQSIAQPNRFRKLVETAVQSNRQLVESAQREETEQCSTSQKPGHIRAEIDVYKEGSFDTATWLYHLVFSPEIPDLPANKSKQITAPYQASVTDEGAENLAEPVTEITIIDAPVTADRSVIVWGQQTETNRVVDRLLSSWTTLTNEQIILSSTHSKDDELCSSVHEMVEEMKDDADMTFEKWQEENSLDEAEVTAYRRSRTKEIKRRSTRDSKEDDDSDLIRGPSHRNRPPIVEFKRSERRKSNSPRRTHVRPKPKRGASQQDPWSNSSDQTTTTATQHRIAPTEYDDQFSFPPTNPFSYTNPFKPGCQPRFQEYYSNSQFLPTPYGTTPWHPPPMPSAPVSNDTRTQTESEISKASAREAKDTGSSSNPVNDKQKQDSLDDRIIELLNFQQDRQIKFELEQANIVAEAEFKRNLAQRTEHDASIRRLEILLLQQKEEQLKSEELWRAERIELERNAKKQAEEAKALAEREIKASLSIQETEQKALEFAQAEVLRVANEAAAAKVRDERKKTERKSKERFEQYEKLLDKAVRQQSGAQGNGEQPLRRTRIADGTRSIEVTEYTGNTLDTDTNFPFSPFAFFQEEVRRANMNERNGNNGWCPGQSRLCELRSSTSTPSTSRTPLASTSEQKQKMIIFPKMTNEESSKVSDLQSALAKVGLRTIVENSEFEDLNTEPQLTSIGRAVVRSSILWEAPSLSIGSELLATYRKCGWRPPYARSSDIGRTYYLGDQAVHSYFFRPDYKPQFASCNTVSSESIVIDKALIHEYALVEYGLSFKSTDCGSYVLDGRLQYSDIETLIERSFSMRETHLRREHRQLQWHDDRMVEANTNERDVQPATPKPSSFTMENRTSYATSVSTEDNEHDSAGSDHLTTPHQNSAPLYLQQNILDEGIPRLEQDTISHISSSATSWSSKSKNPFRKRAEKEQENMRGSNLKSPAKSVQNLGDDFLVI